MLGSTIHTPHVDWLTLSPELSLLGAGAVCLMFAVLVPASWRRPLGGDGEEGVRPARDRT